MVTESVMEKKRAREDRKSDICREHERDIQNGAVLLSMGTLEPSIHEMERNVSALYKWKQTWHPYGQ